MRSNADLVKTVDEERILNGIDLIVYTKESTWLEEMENVGLTVIQEDLKSSMNGATNVLLAEGDNPLGLFNINISSSVLSNHLVRDEGDANVIAFSAAYEEGIVDLKLNNFYTGNINGFGGYWKQTDNDVDEKGDIVLLVNGEEINISKKLKGFPNNKHGFVGFKTMISFNEIKFISKGLREKNTRFRLRHIKIGGISITKFPTVSPSPTTTPRTWSPSKSYPPTILSTTSFPPSLVPTTEEQYLASNIATLIYSFIDGLRLVFVTIVESIFTTT